jgi:short-subunit dehydrogenase
MRVSSVSRPSLCVARCHPRRPPKGSPASPRARAAAGDCDSDAVPLALITGPTAGIGRAFATALAAEGHDLVLVSRDLARLESVAGQLSARYRVRCDALAADLSDLEQTRRVEARLRAEPFDVVVNNAGFGMTNAFEDHDVEQEQASLDVMVGAVLRLSHAALVPMLTRGRGDIVNVSSVAGYLPRGTYAAHKAWVTSFSAWAGMRYSERGVRVMALCPGFVRTEFHQRMNADLNGIPAWMWLSPDRVVRDGLRDLRRGRRVSVPTMRYKGLAALARVTPPGLAERLARRGR